MRTSLGPGVDVFRVATVNGVFGFSRWATLYDSGIEGAILKVWFVCICFGCVGVGTDVGYSG